MTKQTVFKARCNLDAARQPGRNTTLTALTTSLKNIPADHPYDLPFPDRLQLCALVQDFALGAQGNPATVHGEYLYRFASIGQLVRDATWRGHTNDALAFGALTAAYLQDRAWLALRRFARGSFHNYRGFSWWTSFDPTTTHLWDAWRRVGLLDDWMMQESVMLRCRVDGCPALRVPNIVDGFEGPVFEATNEPPPASTGTAIDLSQATYGPGEPELVVPALPVTCIDVQPVLISRKVKSRGTPARDDVITWRRLENYYRTCSA
jgi:hypothetical protein